MVVPAYAYPAGLDRLLAALTRQRLSESFEVLVMDDGSPEPLEPVTKPYAGALNLRYLRLEGGGPARARNAGARCARAEWVAFTDHDCEPEPEWLEQLSQAFARYGPAVLGGAKVTGLPGSDWSVAHDMLGEFASGWSSPVSTPYFSTNNLAVPRRQFLDLGGFDERFPYAQEDREFCARWAAQGGEIRGVPEAIVRHSHSFTAHAFCRQHYRYGVSAVYYHRIRNSARVSWPFGLRLRFYSGLLRHPWRELRPFRAARISAILAVSQVCYGCGYYRGRRK